jgi:hypothetical protein
VSDDPHAPTTAGPVPTPVVGPSEATTEHPAGTAAGGGAASSTAGDGVGAKASQAADQAKDKAAQVAGQAQQVTGERPEILVGVAFAGGFVAAMILKRLGR